MAIDYTWNRIKEAASGLEPFAKYHVAANAAAKAQAKEDYKYGIEVEQWASDRRTEALKVALNHHATALTSIRDAVTADTFDLDDPTNLGIYTQAFTNFNKTQRDYYESAGITPTGDTTITHLTPFFASIFDKWSKDHPNGDPATLKWGKEKGVWGDVIKKLDPAIKRDDAHAVWEKIWKSKFGDGKKGGLVGRDFWEWPWEGGQGLIGGIASQVAGTPMDLAAGLGNIFLSDEDKIPPPVGGREWFSKQETMTIGDVAGLIKDKLTGEPVRDVPPLSPWATFIGDMRSGKSQPTTAPSSMTTGPLTSPGFIRGATDMIKQQALSEAPTSTDIKTLDETLKSLEEIESDAQERVTDDSLSGGGGGGGQSRDRGKAISQEAASFLAKLIEYMTAYGEDKARDYLAEDFSSLSRTAQNELQSYLMTESEALA
tara:strand:+ start:4826 stop:6115 length:1290 start_codon:yes stop_codon:yes gene_type:complete